MSFCDHALYKLLSDLNIIAPDNIELYASRVRDREDIKVFRCKTSGVIFLSDIKQAEISYYIDKNVQAKTLTCEDHEIPFANLDNDCHRADAFGHLIEGKRWLDFGCGTGGLLEILSPKSSQAWGLEPNNLHRNNAVSRGVQVVENKSELPGDGFDIITLFHVFEHLADPVGMGTMLKGLLRPGGTLLVEVPHARDFLLETLDCSEFRHFTLWSEHLILHTRKSLATVLGACGFATVDVSGHQRFPLSNHLHWLRHGLPGGHEKWGFIDQPDLMAAYSENLMRIDQTDTIIALAQA